MTFRLFGPVSGAERDSHVVQLCSISSLNLPNEAVTNSPLTYSTSDVSGRAIDIWGDHPEVWDFSKQPAADIVVINLGTNDNNSANNVTTDGYVAQYTMLIEGVHTVWPKAQIILVVSCPLVASATFPNQATESLGRLWRCR